MKKVMMVAFIAIALMAFVPAQAHAQYANGNAIGASLGGGLGGGALAISGKIDTVDLMFTGNFSFGNSFTVNAATDWWWIHNNIGRVGQADVFLYTGPGAAINLGIGNGFSINLGARWILGFSWMVDQPAWRNWEIFTEAALGVNVLGTTVAKDYVALNVLGIPLTFNDQTPAYNFLGTLGLGVNLGFRYWF